MQELLRVKIKHVTADEARSSQVVENWSKACPIARLPDLSLKAAAAAQEVVNAYVHQHTVYQRVTMSGTMSITRGVPMGVPSRRVLD